MTVILYQVSKPYHTARVSFSLILNKIDWSKKVKSLIIVLWAGPYFGAPGYTWWVDLSPVRT